MSKLSGASLGIAAIVAGTALAWAGAERIQASGALQDPDMVVAESELVAAMPRAVRESSGVAIGQAQSVLWTHNDSGDGPVLYAVDLSGTIVGRVRLDGVRARDFEDLGQGACPAASGSESVCLYVADTGNNDRDRATLSIYILPEPVLDEQEPVVTPLRVRFRYPDRRSDVEALAVSQNRDIYLVTKGRRAGIRSYRISAAEVDRVVGTDERAEVEALGRMPLEPSSRLRRLVTGGTFAGDMLVLRTYEGVYGFLREEGTWTRVGGCVIRPQEPAGEAIAYEGEQRFLLTSEAGSTRYPSIHRITCPLGAS